MTTRPCSARRLLIAAAVGLCVADDTRGDDVILERDGVRVMADRSHQVLRLSLPERVRYVDDDEPSGRDREPTITAALPRLRKDDFVSAAMLLQKAKIFDDGLLAAVELAAQEGTPGLLGKRELLRKVTAALAASQPADGPTPPLPRGPAVVWSAAKLGDASLDVPPTAEESVDRVTAEFLGDAKVSKPLGFYTWSPELEAIFRQGRLLQTPIERSHGVDAVAAATRSERAVEQAYRSHLRLMARLTNQAATPNALDDDAEQAAFFPASRSAETDLIVELYGDRPIPEGFEILEELIARLRDGRIDPTPGAETGWYGYQLWASSPLVTPDDTPEAKHLELDPRYRKHLEGLFKANVALARETHIKQLDVPAVAAAAPIEVSNAPDLDVEPTATHYLRRGAGYRFVRGVLEQAFGPEGLGRLRRMTPEGPVATPLGDELQKMERIFVGAYARATRQLGGEPAGDFPLELGPIDLAAGAATFARWRGEIGGDPDLGRDVRMMVPVYHDVQRQLTKVWCVLGWAERPLDISFAVRPELTVVNADGSSSDRDLRPTWMSASHSLLYPVTAEVYVSELMDRDEFRAHCDRYRTRSEILNNLPGADSGRSFLRRVFTGRGLWAVAAAIAIGCVYAARGRRQKERPGNAASGGVPGSKRCPKDRAESIGLERENRG